MVVKKCIRMYKIWIAVTFAPGWTKFIATGFYSKGGGGERTGDIDKTSLFFIALGLLGYYCLSVCCPPQFVVLPRNFAGLCFISNTPVHGGLA